MILILSAVVNLSSTLPTPNSHDRASRVFAIALLTMYGFFTFLITPYILVKYWMVPAEERLSAVYPEFEVLVK